MLQAPFSGRGPAAPKGRRHRCGGSRRGCSSICACNFILLRLNSINQAHQRFTCTQRAAEPTAEQRAAAIVAAAAEEDAAAAAAAGDGGDEDLEIEYDLERSDGRFSPEPLDPAIVAGQPMVHEDEDLTMLELLRQQVWYSVRDAY